MTEPVLIELFGTSTCPYTSELREDLLWRGVPFTEYDVETDGHARDRLIQLTGAPVAVPVLVESGRVKQVGWQGRSCAIAQTG